MDKKFIILDYGVFGLVSSCHEWIAGIGKPSIHGDMMKKENKEETCLKTYLYSNGWMNPRRARKTNTSVKPYSKTKDHWRPDIIKLCGGEKKEHPRTDLSINNNSVQSISVVSFQVIAWEFICHITIVGHVYCKSKCILKWKSNGHSWIWRFM